MKIAIAAGGTGGHLYPGIALGQALVHHEVVFLVRRGDLGKPILEKSGFKVREISGQGFPRKISLKIFTFPFKFVMGILEALFFLISQKPDRVVGMGGYLSVPVVIMAKLLGIPTLLHEQNVIPGMANKFLSRLVDSVAVSFEDSLAFFPKSKVWVSGLPVRSEMGQTDRTTGRRNFGLELETTTYLVFGGSLGAQKLNSTVVETWDLLTRQGHTFQVLHITGAGDYARVENLYKGMSVKSKVFPYCHAMADAYAAADVVISRAGASTLAELMLTKRRAVLIPYPYATNDHQTANAQVLVKMGQGALIFEKDLTPAKLCESLITSVPLPKSTAGDGMSAAAARLAQRLTQSSD